MRLNLDGIIMPTMCGKAWTTVVVVIPHTIFCVVHVCLKKVQSWTSFYTNASTIMHILAVQKLLVE